MRAAVLEGYGDARVLSVRDVPIPEPRAGELLVRVRAAALNPKDILIRRGKFRLLSGRHFPRGVGFDWAGEVVRAGPGVSGYREGDALYGMIDSWRAGACAEYAVVRVGECAPKPSTLDFEPAAAVPLAASTALQALRDLARVGPGSRVLINGASGGVGVFAIQIARCLGAEVVTTSSDRNVALCRELGAHRALDYAAVDALREPVTYDAVFDVFGNRTLADARPVLAAHGVYVTTVVKARVFRDVARSLFLPGPRARLVVVRSRRRDLEIIGQWIEGGRLRPVLDEIFPLERIAEADARVETKHARGKVVVRVA